MPGISTTCGTSPDHIPVAFADVVQAIATFLQTIVEAKGDGHLDRVIPIVSDRLPGLDLKVRESRALGIDNDAASRVDLSAPVSDEVPS